MLHLVCYMSYRRLNWEDKVSCKCIPLLFGGRSGNKESIREGKEEEADRG